MDSDVAIKLIYTSALTIIYTILFVRAPMDVALITSLTSGFVGALSAVISYNLGQRRARRATERRQTY